MATADYGGFLLGPLSRALPPAAIDWLVAEIDRQRAAADERRLAIALGLTSRKIGRLDLALTPDEAASAQRLRAGWQPELWATDEAARISDSRRRATVAMTRRLPHGSTGCARWPR